ncbi:MAG: 3-dehydroquinate synthase [Oscillospiraceae bacterium]
MKETTVNINVGQGYRVNIGGGLIDRCGEILSGVLSPRRTAVVTDSVVAGLYLDRVKDNLKAAGFDPICCVFEHGEGSKNLSTLSDILEFFAENHLTRSDLVVALGGGVTGDMAGFAAGVYQRGVRYAQIPTTLLAAVDSSVGGKTAVNLSAGKNLAGVFLQPLSVICDTDTFKTLPPDIFADGAAESIKYGVLTDERIFEFFAGGDVQGSLTDIISRCVSIKGALVERDEHDNGDRRFLNLGHTIGHAIENLSGYTFPHGHAVAVGMVMIARAGEKMGITQPGTSEKIAEVLKKNDLPTSVDYSAQALLPAALSDKKRNGGELTIVIPERIGKCILKTIPVSELGEIISLSKE